MAGIGRFKWTVLPAAAGAAQDAASSHGWLRPNRLCRRIAMAERAAPLWLALGVASGLGTARRRRPAAPWAARGFASRAKLRPGASAVATCRWPESRTTFAFGHGVTV